MPRELAQGPEAAIQFRIRWRAFPSGSGSDADAGEYLND
jgi:hypothetical protein